MAKASKIKYNPAISVEENAKRNGVSEAAIRYHIKKKKYDRQRERKLIIVAACKKYYKEHPETTRKELHENTGYSLTTIREYWKYITTEEELPVTNSDKVQKLSLRQDNNFYATHPSIVQDLLDVEKFEHSILEPFCGNGKIAETLINNGYEVEAYDLIDRGYGKQGDFFLTNYPEEEFDIVTNPPYNEIHIIIKRCIQLCKSKVALLLPLSYLAGVERWEDLYKDLAYSPSRVYIYINRPFIGKNGGFDKRVGSKIDYAWYIWEKGIRTNPVIKWIANNNYTSKNKITKTRKKIDALISLEKKNGEAIVNNHSMLPVPTIQNLTAWETYDASKYLCYAFKKKGDLRKGVWIPFGNMNSGFPFDLCGEICQTSESAYICGLFSDNTPEHIAIQERLLPLTNGKLAKGDIRHHNKHLGRKDWNEFNVQWMMFVVWQKVIGNEDFRNLLMAVPDGATIIEDTTFQKKPKDNDTTQFWGARNQGRKEFDALVDDYISKTRAFGNKAEKKKLKAASMNDFCDYGVFEGCNVMGKILTICRKCLADGTEPPIDYELLRSKHIHLLGRELTF